jgi:copper resistance protein C
MRPPGTAPTRRVAWVAAAGAVGLGGLLVVVGAVPASAHASLVRSSPAAQSAMGTAPTSVRLTFDENIRAPSLILVTDASGASVAQGKTSVVDNIVSTHVRIAASGDFYAVYRVVSADGHPVSGRLAFSVGTGKPPAAAGTVAATDQTAATGSHHETMSTGPPTRVIAMIAGLALVGGLGLLTVRRWAPNLWSKS